MEGAKNRIVELWAIVEFYLLKDIYNIDEMVLFWKAILDTILAIKALLGIKN